MASAADIRVKRVFVRRKKNNQLPIRDNWGRKITDRNVLVGPRKGVREKGGKEGEWREEEKERNIDVDCPRG